MWQWLKYEFGKMRYGTHIVLYDRKGHLAALILNPRRIDDLHWVSLGKFTRWCRESNIPYRLIYRGRCSDAFEIVAEPRNTVAITLRWL